MMENFEDKLTFFIGVTCLTIIVFFSILLIGGLLDSITVQELGIKKVDCYDRDWNVIIGVQCEEMQYCTYFGFAGYEKCSEVKQ